MVLKKPLSLYQTKQLNKNTMTLSEKVLKGRELIKNGDKSNELEAIVLDLWNNHRYILRKL